jgi:hypothetical protein
MFKRLLLIFLILSTAPLSTVSAESDPVGQFSADHNYNSGPIPTIRINGKAINLFEAPAYIDSSSRRIMVPLRFVSEAIGADVNWTSIDKPIVTTVNTPVAHQVILRINDVNASIDGKAIVLDQPPTLHNGRTMVPLRIISEGLGSKVDWDQGHFAVDISATLPDWMNWNPTIEQIVGGNFLMYFKWNPLKDTIQANLTHLQIDCPVQATLFQNGDKGTQLSNSDNTFSNLPDRFYLTVMSNDQTGKLYDHYQIMSASEATARGFSIPKTNDLIILDQFNKVITLGTALRFRGLPVN